MGASVASGQEDLSILVEAVIQGELLDPLSDPTAQLTVFAPTNDAFMSLFGALGVGGLEDIPTDVLIDVLTYHAVPAVAYSYNLVDGMVLPTLTSSGASLTVDLSDGVVIDGVGSDATVIMPDVAAGSSVVHVVDTVLLPFTSESEEIDEAPEMEPDMEEPDMESIASVASGAEELSILVEAVVAAGLLDAITDPEAEFTVFAPTNDAFVSLLGALGVDSLDNVPPEALAEILLYHVVPAVAFSTDLSDGQVLPTLDGDSTLTVNIEEAGIFIEAVGSVAQVVFADVAAGNSVVHVINEVLLPFSLGDDVESAERQPLPYLPFDPFNSCRIRYSFCHEDFDCCSNECTGSYFTYPFYPYCAPIDG